MRALGLQSEVPEARQWRTIAAFDAAMRMAQALASSGAIARGAEARRVVEELAASPELISETYWSVREDAAAPECVLFRGAVFIVARGRVKQPAAELPEELSAALREAPVSAGRELWKMVSRDSLPVAAMAALALAASTAGGLLAAVLFRGLFDL